MHIGMASLKAYVITRALLTIPMVLILLTVIFFLLRILPGDPIRAMYGPKIPEDVAREIMHAWGLDKPWHLQYIDYLLGLLHGDLGISYRTKRPVWDEIMTYFPATLELSIFSMAIAVLFGALFGMLSAYRRGSTLDTAVRLLAISIYAVPIFWLGLMLQLAVLMSNTPIPISSRISPLREPARITGLYVLDSILTCDVGALVDSLSHLALPSLTLGLVLSGAILRLTRSNMLETLTADYVLAARARGIREFRVVFMYAFRNAIIPVVTMAGMLFALLMAGAVLTENTFNWPGIGTYLVTCIANRDYPAIQGTVTFIAVLVAIVNLITDIVNAVLDPRIRY